MAPPRQLGAFLLFAFRGFQLTGVSSSIQHSVALQPLLAVVSVRTPTAGKLGPFGRSERGRGGSCGHAPLQKPALLILPGKADFLRGGRPADISTGEAAGGLGGQG